MHGQQNNKITRVLHAADQFHLEQNLQQMLFYMTITINKVEKRTTMKQLSSTDNKII
jgi:hypothetical protein